jgi:hypothetical protein
MFWKNSPGHNLKTTAGENGAMYDRNILELTAGFDLK